MTLPEHEFIFLRHGQTEYNRERRFQGQLDVPLDEAGFRQARAAAEMLAGRQVSRVVASPATRVQQTIKPFLQTCDIPLHIDDDLMEFSVGSLQGRLHDDVRKEFGLTDADSLWSILPDDAEVWSDFMSRAVSAVARWTQQYPDETILIASHGLVFRALAEALLGREIYSNNAEPHHFRRDDEGWRLSPLML